MEAKAINSHYQISLHRIRSSSCSSNNRNNSIIKFSTYKCNGNSKIYSNSFAWNNDFYTRKNYKGVMLVRQSNDIQSSAVTPGPPPGKPWSNWLVGVTLSLILPFVTNKWGRLMAIKNEVCAVLSTVETVAETVEKFAEEVAHVADEVANNLPEGGTLQNIACNIANAAEEAAKDAHFVDQFIDKVEDVENEIVSSITSGVHKTDPHEVEGNLNEVTKDDNIQSDKQIEQKHKATVEEVPQNEIIDQPN